MSEQKNIFIDECPDCGRKHCKTCGGTAPWRDGGTLVDEKVLRALITNREISTSCMRDRNTTLLGIDAMIRMLEQAKWARSVEIRESFFREFYFMFTSESWKIKNDR